MQTKHAKLSASSSDRWLRCPGSIRLSEGIEQTTSIYAEEGTLAHDLASKILLKESFNIEEYDPNMVNEVLIYTDYVETIPKDIILIEHKFDLSPIYPGMFGTSDCTIYQEKTKTLHVIDLKFGRGVFVKAENNTQLLYYALGAFEELKLPVREVVLTIVQPRYASDDKIRSHVIHASDLYDFSIDLIEGAKKTEDPNAPLVKGFHCKFCPAKKICPEINKNPSEEAKSVFSSIQDEESSIQSKNAMSLDELLNLTRHGGE